MRTVLTVMGLAFALTVGFACGDDDDTKTDSSVTNLDAGPGTEDGTPPDPDGTVAADTAVPAPDTAVPPPEEVPNSGQTCDMSTPCPEGDVCLLLQGWPEGKGMCMGPCTNQGEMCATPDPTTLSACALSDKDQTQFFCLYICEVQGQTFACPDPATQECVPAPPGEDGKDPGVSVCQPKGDAAP